MVRLAQIYKGKEAFENYLNSCNFNKEAICLVKLFTSNLPPQNAVQAAQEIKNLLPNASLVGASSAQAVLCNGKQLKHETMVIIETYQLLQIKVATFSFAQKTAQQLARQVYETFCPKQKESPGVVQILFSNPNMEAKPSQPHFDVDSFVHEINQLDPILKLAGGFAGDLFEWGIAGFVFNECGVIENGAIAFELTGSEVHNFIHVSNSMEVLSPVFEVSKTDGIFIEEIEGQEASAWIFDYLDLDKEQQTTYDTMEDTVKYDYLLHFPLVLEDAGGSGRFAKYNKQDNKISLYHSKIKDHTRFRMGYVNPMKTVQEARVRCEDVLDVPIEYLFVYVCLFRKLCLNNCAKWELNPFQRYDVCGIFMMGEIAFQDEKNNFHNGACVVTGLAENEKYVLPDIHCLDDTEPLKDDLHFLRKAKDKGKAYLKSKNSTLASSLENVDLSQNRNVDEYIGLPNFYQFEEDRLEKKYNKLALVESLTADTSIAVYGHQKYYEAIRDVVHNIQTFLCQERLDENFKLYTLNYKTCILAASASISDNYFMECTQNFYQRFEYVSSAKESMSGVLRFVVVLNQKNLIEAGMNMLLANTNQDNNYLICDYSAESHQSVLEESKVIDILNRAINKKTVTPFYQGLRNNKTGKIDKYEALMRVIDSTGKVHTPFSFMEVSKKYKYYSRISQMMIEQVLRDFQHRNESVSLNITLHDIQSEAFRKWILQALQHFPSPSRLIFEFVESENYHSVELLEDFVKEIRAFGCKIAIDDFGSGYSTLATIISLRPDYIKIDGSIIRNLLNSEECLIILNTIRYLAQQLKVETVAEFVERKELQQVVELYSISYSQGFYFSKPQPIAHLQKIPD